MRGVRVYSVVSADIVSTGVARVLAPNRAGEVDVKRHTGVGAVGDTSRAFDFANRCVGLTERSIGGLRWTLREG